MAGLTFIIEYGGMPAAPKKEFRLARQAAFEEIGLDWHEKKLPGHFLHSAYRKYGYERRSYGHMLSKFRKQMGVADQPKELYKDLPKPTYWELFNTDEPLVFTGESEKMLTGRAEIKSLVAGGVHVKMFGPAHFYAYRKDYNQPDKAAEVTRLSSGEVAEYRKMLHAGVAKRLNASTTRRRVVITA